MLPKYITNQLTSHLGDGRSDAAPVIEALYSGALNEIFREVSPVVHEDPYKIIIRVRIIRVRVNMFDRGLIIRVRVN